MRIKLPNLKKRLSILIVSGLIIAGTSGVAAFNAMQPATADVMTPTQVTVQEHEDRLDRNESDIAATKERVSEVEQKADAISQEVETVRERVTVVERHVTANPAQPQAQQLEVQEPVATPQPSMPPYKPGTPATGEITGVCSNVTNPETLIETTKCD